MSPPAHRKSQRLLDKFREMEPETDQEDVSIVMETCKLQSDVNESCKSGSVVMETSKSGSVVMDTNI